MVYGKPTATKRYVKRYKRTIPKTITQKAYSNVVIGCAVIISDTTSVHYDLVDTVLTNSSDWLLIKNNYSEFKVARVIVDFSPFLVSPVDSTSVSNGWITIRDGYYVAPLTSLNSNELAKFPNTIPFNNCQPFTLSRRVTSGNWFHGNAITPSENLPKLVLYTSLTNVASTNMGKGSIRIRFFLLARGTQIEQ